MTAQPNEELKPYTVEVDDHSDDCGTVYKLTGPNVGILSKDEDLLWERAGDMNLGFEQGQALLRGQAERDMTPEPDYKAMWEKLKYWLKHLAPGVTLNQKFQVENNLVLAKIAALETSGPTETQAEAERKEGKL